MFKHCNTNIHNINTRFYSITKLYLQNTDFFKAPSLCKIDFKLYFSKWSFYLVKTTLQGAKTQFVRDLFKQVIKRKLKQLSLFVVTWVCLWLLYYTYCNLDYLTINQYLKTTLKYLTNTVLNISCGKQELKCFFFHRTSLSSSHMS